MSPQPTPLRPHRVIAARVKELRGKDMTAAQLAARMSEIGFKWDRFTVQNLESGRRATVTVEELLGLAYVLDVAPIHLLVPTESQEKLVEARAIYAVAPELGAPAAVIREWVRGHAHIGSQDPRTYFSKVPPDEFAAPQWRETGHGQVVALDGEVTDGVGE